MIFLPDLLEGQFPPPRFLVSGQPGWGPVGKITTLSGGCDMRDIPSYARSTIGFDHLFSLLQQDAEAASGYPPYNIERSGETNYRITVAVAGFREKDLDVEV